MTLLQSGAAIITQLKGVKSQIYLCLDNDPAGDDATVEMQDALDDAQDIRERFAPHKDVNAYLQSRAKKT